jgi:hypothetical protein
MNSGFCTRFKYLLKKKKKLTPILCPFHFSCMHGTGTILATAKKNPNAINQ